MKCRFCLDFAEQHAPGMYGVAEQQQWANPADSYQSQQSQYSQQQQQSTTAQSSRRESLVSTLGGESNDATPASRPTPAEHRGK